MELSEQARQAKNAYQQAYRRKHPEKIKEYQRRYWEKQAGNILPDEVKKLSSQGMSQRQIAEKLGGLVPNKSIPVWMINSSPKSVKITNLPEPRF